MVMGIYSLRGRSSRTAIIKFNFNTMPKMDNTGPQGLGPMTGRGMGLCGRGFGYGRGFGGRNFSWRKFASPKNELATLEDEEKILEEELAIIREEKEALKKELK